MQESIFATLLATYTDPVDDLNISITMDKDMQNIITAQVTFTVFAKQRNGGTRRELLNLTTTKEGRHMSFLRSLLSVFPMMRVTALEDVSSLYYERMSVNVRRPFRTRLVYTFGLRGCTLTEADQISSELMQQNELMGSVDYSVDITNL